MTTQNTDTTDTTTTEPAEPQDAPQEPQEPTEPPQEPQDEPDDAQGGKEAAKYRRRLRETEAERDQLRERLDSLQRTEVERIASATVAKPAALWAAGTKLEDVLDDAGNVDQRKVTEAITAASDALGLSRTPPPGYSPLAGRVPERPGLGAGFDDAFGPQE